MSKLLIAVESCQRDRNLGHHETIRQRWGKTLSDVSDVRFFMGGPEPKELLSDEIWLDVPDDFFHLSIKTKAVCDWVLRSEYDFLFKCDCDTTIFISKFKGYDYKNEDYAGRFNGGYPGEKGLYAAGAGYFLSRKACEIISTQGGVPVEFEDVMVGNTLEPYIISGQIKARHIETSIYSASKGGGEPHEAAPVCILIRRPGGEPFYARASAVEHLLKTRQAELVKE
jgi:hypothetical protein